MDKESICEVSSTVETESVKLRWKIEKFDMLPILQRMRSPEFISAGITWCVDIALKPWETSGEKATAKKTVEFRLIRCGTVGSLDYSVFFVRFRISGETFFKTIEKVVSITKFELPEMRFDKEIILKSCSASKDLIVKCELDMACKLKHIMRENKENALTGSTGSVQDAECLSTLSSDFLSLFSSKEFCDVTLKVDGVEFSAHRAVMAARSPVFAAMFRHELLETKTSEISITDISSLIFEKILMFMYSGKLCEISASDACELYTAADKYALLELKKKCIEIMYNNLSDDNIVTVAILASQHADDQLMEVADDFLKKNINQILNTQQWKEFSQHHSDVYKEVVERLLRKTAHKA